jgi:general secretion pathway protein D
MGATNLGKKGDVLGSVLENLCRSAWSCCVALSLMLALGACSSHEQKPALVASPTPAATATEPPAALNDTGNQQQPVLEPKAEFYPGSATFTGSVPHHVVNTSVGEQGDITLNFVNAEVKDVAKAVLGDYLKLNYEIGANVQGTVTIQTSQPLKRSQVLPALEQALRLNGMAVVQSHDIYKVVPIADAQHVASAARSGKNGNSVGYGIDIVPVHYVGAADMQKLLEPLAPSAGIMHVDAARNVLIIEGTEEERQTLRDDIALFDADWLSGMSFAIFTPNYTDADELTKELTQVLGGLNSPVSSLVQLVPIQRLNAVLAISHQPKYLEHVRAWVNRLDRPGQGSDKRIYIYSVQNGRASDLANTLGKLLFGGSGGSSSSSRASTGPTIEPAPATAMNSIAPPPPSSGGTSTSSSSGGGSGGTAGAASGGGVSVSGSAPGVGTLSITADETNNALAILATPQQYGVVEAALKKLDASPLQVLLEAAIVEVTLTNNIKYGVQYFYHDSNNQVVLTNSGSTSIAPSLPGFAYMFSNGNNINAVLDALAQVTHVEVISSPEVMVLNNQTAQLQVGDSVPIITEQATSTETGTAPIVSTVQYEDTGVILKVTPRVNRSGMVMMDISQEVSQVADAQPTNTVDSPTIQQRKISSSVAVQDNETVALGGLISRSHTTDKNGIPFLQDIPLLGSVFRSSSYDDTKTELMVLITPHVVDDVRKARKVTDELRHKLPAVEAVLRKPF